MKSRKPKISKTAFNLMVVTVSVILIWFIVILINFYKEPIKEPVINEAVNEEPVIEDIPSPIEPVEIIEPVEPIEVTKDDNNYIYPFNTMSTDWGAEVYQSGFKYYQLPQKFVNTGGCFPEVVQVYLWSLCQEKNLNYYMVVALIERESGYRWDATSADGTTKGYMQIYDKWHKDRMQVEGVDDIYNPYGNIRVGVNLLHELVSKYGADYHRVLMSYNMGEAGCRKANNRGVYSTAYSIGILLRAQELEQEIQG